jgi:hypothetical protein
VPAYGAEIAYRLTTRSNAPVRVVIQDVTGDTLRTLNGSSGLGLHKVVWDFRGRTPPAPPLSPSQRRDSIQLAQRRAFVFDSLGKSGMDTVALGRFRRLLEGGDMQQMMQAFASAFSGAAAGPTPIYQGDRFNARPGEQAAPARGGGAGAMGGMAAQAGITDPNLAFQIVQLITPPGQNPFTLFATRPQAPTVDPGDYLVSISVGGQTLRQRLRVERASGTGGSGLPFQER